MSFYNLRSWLAKYKILPKDKLNPFANEIYKNTILINEIFNVLCDPRHQEYDSVYHQLYEFFRSPEKKLRLFCVQYIPTLIFIYLKEHSRLKGFDSDIFSKLESFLMALYNMSISEGILNCDDSTTLKDYEIIYPLNHPSIYHDPQFYQLNTLIEHSKLFFDLNIDSQTLLYYPIIPGSPIKNSTLSSSSTDYLTFKQVIETETILNVNAENRYKFLSGLMYLYNIFLADLTLQSLKLSCLVLIDLCISSFENHFEAAVRGSVNTRASQKFRRSILGNEQYCRYVESQARDNRPANRIAADQNLYCQFLRTIYFCLYNGASDIALEALEAVNLRASYHLFHKNLLMISCIKNSIIPPISTKLASLDAKYGQQFKHELPEDFDNDRTFPFQEQFSHLSSPLALYLSAVPMTLTSKTAITNASFKLKKLPEDISPLLPPITSGHYKNLETVKEEDLAPGVAVSEKDKDKKAKQGTTFEHHAINALSSFLPQGAAKFWAKTFSIEPSSLQAIDRPSTKSGTESPTVAAGGGFPSSKRLSIKGHFSQQQQPSSISGYESDVHQPIPSDMSGVAVPITKSKKNILNQVKNKLKELQVSSQDNTNDLANNASFKESLQLPTTQSLSKDVPSQASGQQHEKREIFFPPTSTTAGNLPTPPHIVSPQLIPKIKDTLRDHSSSGSDQDEGEEYTIKKPGILNHLLRKQKGVVIEEDSPMIGTKTAEKLRRESIDAKDKDKFNLGKILMKEIRELGKNTEKEPKESGPPPLSGETFIIPPSSSSSVLPSATGHEKVVIPEPASLPSIDSVKKILKKKSNSSKDHKETVPPLNIVIPATDHFEQSLNFTGRDEDYPNIRPSLPPLSPISPLLDVSTATSNIGIATNKDQAAINFFSEDTTNNTTSPTHYSSSNKHHHATDVKFNELLSKFVKKKLTRKKSDAHHVKSNFPTDNDHLEEESKHDSQPQQPSSPGAVAKREATEYNKTGGGGLLEDFDKIRVYHKPVAGLNDSTKQPEIQVTPFDAEETIPSGMFDKHQPSIRPIISDDDDNVKRTILTTGRETTNKSAEQDEGRKQKGLEDLSTVSPEDRKNPAKKIKSFFDNALSNVKEEFENKDNDVNVVRKALTHTTSSGEEKSPSKHHNKKKIKKKVKKIKKLTTGDDLEGTTSATTSTAATEKNIFNREKINRLIGQLLQADKELAKVDSATASTALISPKVAEDAMMAETLRRIALLKEDEEVVVDKESGGKYNKTTTYNTDKNEHGVGTTSTHVSSKDKIKILQKMLLKKLSHHLNITDGSHAASSSEEDDKIKRGDRGETVHEITGYYSSPVSSGSEGSDEENENLLTNEMLKINLKDDSKPSGSTALNLKHSNELDEDSFISERFNKLQKLQNKRLSKNPKDTSKINEATRNDESHKTITRLSHHHKEKTDEISKFIEKLRALNMSKSKSSSTSDQPSAIKTSVQPLESELDPNYGPHIETFFGNKFQGGNEDKSLTGSDFISSHKTKTSRKGSISAPSSDSEMTGTETLKKSKFKTTDTNANLQKHLGGKIKNTSSQSSTPPK